MIVLAAWQALREEALQKALADAASAKKALVLAQVEAEKSAARAAKSRDTAAMAQAELVKREADFDVVRIRRAHGKGRGKTSASNR